MDVTPTYDLFVDDSGTRSLDTPQANAQAGPDAFALGGVLIASENVAVLTAAINAFKVRFQITSHLRSYDIRNKKKAFNWLGTNAEKAKEFYGAMNDLMAGMPCWATATVIERPGYNARYKGKYGRDRWELCKSAYDILLERAAKIADADKRRLRVLVEETGPREDALIRSYHKNLREAGLQFAKPTSDKYGPLTAKDFERITMKNPKFFRKGNPLGDLSDLVLFPMVMAKFKPDYAPYIHLRDHKKLIDAKLENGPADCGIKYYCFDDPKYWDAPESEKAGAR